MSHLAHLGVHFSADKKGDVVPARYIFDITMSVFLNATKIILCNIMRNLS